MWPTFEYQHHEYTWNRMPPNTATICAGLLVLSAPNSPNQSSYNFLGLDLLRAAVLYLDFSMENMKKKKQQNRIEMLWQKNGFISSPTPYESHD